MHLSNNIINTIISLIHSSIISTLLKFYIIKNSNYFSSMFANIFFVLLLSYVLILLILVLIFYLYTFLPFIFFCYFFLFYLFPCFTLQLFWQFHDFSCCFHKTNWFICIRCIFFFSFSILFSRITNSINFFIIIINPLIISLGAQNKIFKRFFAIFSIHPWGIN